MNVCAWVLYVSEDYAGNKRVMIHNSTAIIVFLLIKKHNQSYTTCRDVIQDAIQ